MSYEAWNRRNKEGYLHHLQPSLLQLSHHVFFLCIYCCLTHQRILLWLAKTNHHGNIILYCATDQEHLVGVGGYYETTVEGYLSNSFSTFLFTTNDCKGHQDQLKKIEHT